MITKWFHIRSAGKRRGGGLPARLRFVARRGTTLVELLIAMLILSLVCVSWLEIIGIQSARKEARRREAVERLAGMMDVFMYWSQTGLNPEWDYIDPGYYMFVEDANTVTFESIGNDVQQMFKGGESPIGYQILVDYAADDWSAEELSSWDDSIWINGRLYERNGNESESGKCFFSMSVCLGPNSLL